MRSEFDVIARLRSRFPRIGDDCAFVDGLLLASDAVVGNVDFSAATPLVDVGWKAVTVNVSDVAAMGGQPNYLLVSVAAPSGTDLDALADGIAEAAAFYGCEVVGGDLSTIDGPLVVSIAVVGAVESPVTRGGARPSDDIFVTGPLGASAASGWTVRRVAAVEQGQAARAAGATAMIDVSDGLAADLHHLADESEVGFAIDDVPVAEGATLEQALFGGDDYELVFTASLGAADGIGTRIGVCVADPSVRTFRGEPLERRGWEHRW